MIPLNAQGEELMAAGWLAEELGIPAGFSDRDIIAQAIKAEARTRGDVEHAAKYILGRAIIARGEGKRINRFWFTDQRYLDGLPAIAQPEAPNVRESAERRAREMWESMSDSYKAQHPWGAKA